MFWPWVFLHELEFVMCCMRMVFVRVVWNWGMVFFLVIFLKYGINLGIIDVGKRGVYVKSSSKNVA